MKRALLTFCAVLIFCTLLMSQVEVVSDSTGVYLQNAQGEKQAVESAAIDEQINDNKTAIEKMQELKSLLESIVNLTNSITQKEAENAELQKLSAIVQEHEKKLKHEK